MKKFSYLFIIFGILWCLLGGYYFWLQNNKQRLAFHNYTAPVTKTIQTNKKVTPERVIIKDLGINLALIPAQIRDNKWDTTNDGASYLSSSPLPGNKGNSIIYAHNWASLFGDLIKATPGQSIEVTFSDGSVKTFIVEYTSTISPDQSKVLAQTQDNRITLYTCTGFLDSKRFVVVAILKEAK
jgi:LPXTG-site transpeptidase (sortase) family protein